MNISLMHENEIFILENEGFPPKPFISENSMHDVVDSPTSTETSGAKNHARGEILIFLLENKKFSCL